MVVNDMRIFALLPFVVLNWWSEHGSTDELVDTIKNGSGDMPTLGKKLTKAEITLLAYYVRYFNKDEY